MRDREVIQFLRIAERLAEEQYMEELFSARTENNNRSNWNLQPSAAHPESQSTVPPGVSQPTTMQSTSISPVPTIESTEGTSLTPIEDEHALEETAYGKRNIFDYTEANMDDVTQPMQASNTQPTPGVTNMTGGSTGSSGSTPGVKTSNNENQSNITDRTEGGTTGTTPGSSSVNTSNS